MTPRLCALLLALVPGLALADITLSGSQHIGDTTGGGLLPANPVTRKQDFQNPTNFHLSADATVTAVLLNGIAGTVVPAKLKLIIDGNVIGTTFSGNTFTLSPSLRLTGNLVHTLAIDPGCTGSSPPPTVDCTGTTGNDIAFSSITLVSAQTTTSTNIASRHHIGRNAGENNGYGGNFYPDAPECTAPAPATCSIDLTFALASTQRLTQLRFYRLRNVDNKAQAFAEVRLDGVLLGTLTANQDPLRINTNTVVFAGAHTLSISVGLDKKGAPDDISWDDNVLLYTLDTTSAPAAFNAVDVGADAVTGRLQTKVAGSVFAVDLIALNAAHDGVEPLFTGSVNVELLDATDDSGVLDPTTSCRASWTAVKSLGVATFVTGGRQTFSGSFYNDALRVARLRMTQTDAPVTGCSGDGFALRPDHFVLAVTGPAALASYTASSTPTQKAGRPFTVQVTAVLADGSTITPGFNNQPTLTATSSLLGANLGVMSASNWTVVGGVASTSQASYSEAGAIVLRASDNQFAATDVNDTATVDRTAAGTLNVGRFVPDHFTFTEVAAAKFVPGCAAGGSTPFTYAGQPFFFKDTPSANITAVAAAGTTTTNYDGALYKLTVNPQSTYAVFNNTTFDLTRVPNPDNTAVNQGSGVTLYTVIPPLAGQGYVFTKGTAATVPFNADIGIALNITETDGVDFDSTRGFGAATSGGGIPFEAGGTTGPSYNQVFYGRLVIENAHGSERLPLEVPLRTEYFAAIAGGNGFARNLLDDGTSVAGCTGNALALGDISIIPAIPGTVTASALTPSWTKGQTHLVLNAPVLGLSNVTEEVSLIALISGKLPWLQVDSSDPDMLWNNDPAGMATFGVFRNDERRIYQREVIGP